MSAATEAAENMEEYSRHYEIINGKTIVIETFKLGEIYNSKAEIDFLGSGATIATVSDVDRDRAEARVRQEVREMFGQ